MTKLLKEPLLHFMLIGAGLFGLYAWVNPEEENDAEKIVVSEGRIEQLVSVYQKTWQRPPSENELKAMIDDYVLEEIYYRQAVAMGIDQDDTIIRRRMRQKLEFLTGDVLMSTEVSDADLEKYLSEHPDKFSKDAVYTFEQVYINPQKHEGTIAEYLKQTKAKLVAGEDVASDSYFVAREQKALPAWKVDREFGANFAAKLSELEAQTWSEPLNSGLGVHFIKVTKLEAGTVSKLADVREQVKREWLYDEKLERRRSFNEKFLEQYDVVIEWPSEENDA